MDTIRWFVAHTKARCEKKLAEEARELKIDVVLPCYKITRRYLRKTVDFEKPLFPGYLFLRMLPSQRQRIYQSNKLANLLDVVDQQALESQLNAVMRALESGLEVRLAPEIGVGKRVRILDGPLRGIEGVVEERDGASRVLLQIEFIAQAASVRLDADHLELV
jgi:transcriptional antiterminator RfaH